MGINGTPFIPSAGLAGRRKSGMSTFGSAAFAAAASAQSEAQRAKTGVELLQCDVERLLMITEALWTFIKQQHGYKDEDLANLVADIDLRDGRLDGRVAPAQPHTCPSCGRTLGKNRPLCYYCGQPVQADPFER